MRIAFVMYSFEDQALTSISFWLGRELAKRAHQVTLLALSSKHRFRPERHAQDGVRLVLTPRGVTGRWHYDAWGPHDILTRVLHFVRESYDVLVAYDCRANVYLPFVAAKHLVPLRIMIWGDRWGGGGLASGASRFAFQRRLEEKWEQEMVTQADGVVPTSWTLASVAKEWAVPDDRICWIPHGAPSDLIQSVPRELARKRIGLNGQRPIIGYMGHTLQSLPSFFPAFERLVRRYPHLLILCIGACRPEGRREVEQAGLVPYFRFAGFVPAAQVGDWLSSADLFLIPLSQNSVNDYYRYPGKLGDYMAAGRPVIAPDVGETGRVIREESVGLVVREDLADLEDRICELIEDQRLAEQLGMQARRAAEERFAWPVLASRFEEFITKLAGHE